MSQQYNDPANLGGGGAVPSTIGSQIRVDHYLKKAMIEARKEQYFGQLADVTSMPKNMGKTLRKYHYIPLLDDANVNDEGIDADGAVIVQGGWTAYDSSGVVQTGGTGWVAPANGNAGYYNSEANAWTAAGAQGAVNENGGNLYGTSKDPGVIAGKMPALTENGGRVNRVGHTRVEVSGTIAKYGFFDEYTQESIDFDTDADLRMHVNREMLNGAYEMTEDLLQIDLLGGATTVRYAGTATSKATVSGAGAGDLLTYDDLLRLSIDLDNNRTPKQTKVITGTRLVDTKTIRGGRVMYIGSELIPTLEAMVDLHGNPAFVPVNQYAAGGTVLNGEIGSVGHFRIVVVPEMMSYPGAGADATTNATGSYETNNYFDVFPMLVVGDGAFSTIGFQTDGKTVKFKIKHAAPGSTESYALDPYGETGFMSIKWYYGILIQRAERLGLILTPAAM